MRKATTLVNKEITLTYTTPTIKERFNNVNQKTHATKMRPHKRIMHRRKMVHSRPKKHEHRKMHLRNKRQTNQTILTPPQH
jgi:hypothetical protein